MPALLRNVPTILNVGFNGLVAGRSVDPDAAPMFWDARVKGLERQLEFPISKSEEMRGEAHPGENALEKAAARVDGIA